MTRFITWTLSGKLGKSSRCTIRQINSRIKRLLFLPVFLHWRGSSVSILLRVASNLDPRIRGLRYEDPWDETMDFSLVGLVPSPSWIVWQVVRTLCTPPMVPSYILPSLNYSLLLLTDLHSDFSHHSQMITPWNQRYDSLYRK